jgi:uncharacterized protein
MNLLFLIAGAAAGGYLAQLLRLPGGAALGAMIGAIIVNVSLGGSVKVPRPLEFTSFVLFGVIIGAGVTRADLSALTGLIGPALLVLVSLTFVGVGLSFVLERYFGFDLATAIFATAPGGMGNMALLAKESGANAFTVALIHLIRINGIIFLAPLISLLAKLRT